MTENETFMHAGMKLFIASERVASSSRENIKVHNKNYILYIETQLTASSLLFFELVLH